MVAQKLKLFNPDFLQYEHLHMFIMIVILPERLMNDSIIQYSLCCLVESKLAVSKPISFAFYAKKKVYHDLP
jgi:hypothetical protein